MKKQFITLERLQKLQESTGWLDVYTNDTNSVDHVGNNINTVSVRETNLLYELGNINLRRKQIISELCQKE